MPTFFDNAGLSRQTGLHGGIVNPARMTPPCGEANWNKKMTAWQPIETAPRNDDRILVMGGTWIRGNKQRIPQAYPCLVVWDETEWLICDNEGPRSVVHGPKFWAPMPES